MSHHSTLSLLPLVVLAGLVLMACPTPPPDDDDTPLDPEALDIASDDTDLKLDGISEPPALWVEPQNPLAGGQVNVLVTDPSGGAITVSVVGPGCGTLAPFSGSGTAQTSGAAGQAGSCLIAAVVNPADGAPAQSYQRFVHVQASEPVLPPFDVLEGVWFDSPPPGIADPAAGSIASLQGPSQFINGASIARTGEITGTDSPRAVIISAPGVPGHFFVPIIEDGARDHGFEFTVSFARDVFEQIAGSTVTLSVRVLDANNRLGPPSEQTIQGTEVGQGDVQVGISWDTPTDVDLHLTEPTGDTIFYGNTTSAAGGQLDLDSNPGCSIDGVNHENIFYPPGQSPPGEFTATVRMYSDCEEGGANGTITITHCGEDSPLVEGFSLGATGSEESWTFDSSCQSRIRGTIRYEDFAVTRTGLSAAGAFLPSRYVTVEVVRADDDAVLAEGTTNAAGEYDIAFVNDGEAGVKIQVLSWSVHPRAQQEVLTLGNEVYAWISEEVWDESTEPVIEGADLDIDKATDAAALNIFDLGLRARAKAVAGAGQQVPFTTLRWTDGQRPAGKNASFYSRATKGIYVLGDPADSDAYDDFILGHEYGHLVMDRFSTSNSPGGRHSSNRQEVPTLSWGEGWATYFATQVTRSTTYADTNATGMGVWYDLETLPAEKPLGMAGAVMTGALSEAIVAAVLLDLHDNTNETMDGVEQGEMAIWSVLTHYLNAGSPWFVDRGVAGRDLVDFLDGWFCFGFGLEGATDTEGVRGIVRGIHELTYDFGRAPCE